MGKPLKYLVMLYQNPYEVSYFEEEFVCVIHDRSINSQVAARVRLSGEDLSEGSLGLFEYTHQLGVL